MKKKTPNAQRERPILYLGDRLLLKPLTENTSRRPSRSTILKTGCWSLPQILSNFRNHCQILGPAITSPASSCAAVHHLFQITEKLKPQNLVEISFTNCEFVSKNCARQSGGCDSSDD
jgi:hypothetical protein